MKRAFISVVFSFGALAFAAQAQDKVIRVGVLMPISGPGSYFGVMGKEGIDLALEQVAKTDLKGYKLQVQYEDSACSPLQATNTVKRVLDQLKPHIVIGEECSDASLAIAPILEQAKVVQLNAGSVTMKLTESGYKYVFRIFPNAEQQSAPLVKVARGHLKAQTAVILYEKTNAGNDNAEGFEKPFVAAGGKVLAKIDFGRDVNDFTAIATRVAGLGKVDVIPTYTLEGQGLKITQARAQAGVTKGGGGNAIQIGTIWLPFGFEAKAGKAALGYIRIVQFDPTDTRDVAKNFATAFKAKYNADPTHLNAHAYDQVMLIADVVKRGGKDAQSIRDGLAATKGYSGVTGSVEFDKTNQNTKMDTIHYMETKPDMSWTSLKWN